jgi:hypothetical protein
MFGSSHHVEERQLNQMYDELSKEHSYLMNQLKTKTDEEGQKDLMKELTLVNGLMMNMLKLINVKRKNALKAHL